MNKKALIRNVVLSLISVKIGAMLENWLMQNLLVVPRDNYNKMLNTQLALRDELLRWILTEGQDLDEEEFRAQVWERADFMKLAVTSQDVYSKPFWEKVATLLEKKNGVSKGEK